MKQFIAGLFSDALPSYGRVFGVPFLLSSWAIGTAHGVMSVARGQGGVLDTVWTLAGIGIALYTGSKSLGALEAAVGKQQQPAPPKKADQ